MDGVTIGLLGMLALVVMVMMGVPVVFSLGSIAFVGMWAVRGFDQSVVFLATTAWDRGTNYVFLAIPFFIWLGFLASASGISRKLYNCLTLWLGRIKGGLGVATTVACAAFGTVCGGALTTAQVFAKVSAPEMRNHGYDKNLTYGLCAAAGNIGQLIPPSNLIVVYGVLTGESVGRLLMAGISPGLALTVAFSLVMVAYGIFKPNMVPTLNIEATWKEKVISLKDTIPIVIVGACVVIGLGAGIFSVAESGAVAGFVITLIAIFQRNKFKTFLAAGLDAIGSTSMILPLMACGTMFGKFLTMSGVINKITTTLTSMNLTPITFLVFAVIVYIILGCFIDANSSLIVSLPIFYPMFGPLGINSIHFAMVVLIAVHIGQLTPPVGMNVFGVKAVAASDTTLGDIFKGTLPFLLVMLALLVLYIFVPSLSTFIPNMLYAK